MEKIKLAYCPTRRDVFSREEAIKFNRRIREALKAFSVDIVDLSMALEEEFGIDELGEDEAAGITTVGDLVRLLQSRID